MQRKTAMHEKHVKSILSAKNGMNLYRGCTHGCIYCDSRSLCYQMDHVFEDIEVKVNAPALLEEALKKKRAPCMISTGSMCDPYLPLEKNRRLTRQCLERIAAHGFGATVLTKSDLVLRDMDLFRQINSKAKCVVQMTLTTFDESLCRIIEPNVCTTKRRYEALKAFQEQGIPTVVWLTPLLPFLNDTEENLQGILGDCFDAGVKGIMTFGMGVTLREGDREYFYQKLDEHFPGLKARYMAAFGNSYECPSPRQQTLMALFRRECAAQGVMSEPGEIFAYLSAFEDKTKGEQLSLL